MDIVRNADGTLVVPVRPERVHQRDGSADTSSAGAEGGPPGPDGRSVPQLPALARRSPRPGNKDRTQVPGLFESVAKMGPKIGSGGESFEPAVYRTSMAQIGAVIDRVKRLAQCRRARLQTTTWMFNWSC